MAEALTWLESTTNRYGVPVDKATDIEFEGWWLVEWRTDFAAKAVSDDEHKQAVWEYPVVRLDPDYKPSPRRRRGA